MDLERRGYPERGTAVRRRMVQEATENTRLRTGTVYTVSRFR